MAGIRIGGIGSVAGFGIPYSRTVGSSVGIYTVDEAGGSPTLVTASDVDDRETPVRSPNKRMIAYLKLDSGSGNYTLRVITAGGSDVEVDAGWCRYPMWSPDSSLIVYTTYDSGDEHKVFTVSPDGTGKTAIYTHGTTPATLSRPCFNFDGTLLAFQNENDNKVYVGNADGSGVAVLDDGSTDSPSGFALGADNAISWANGINRLTYGNGRGSGDGKWIAIDADGSDRAVIATEASGDSQGQRQAWDADDSAIIVPDFVLGSGYALRACAPDGSGSALLSPTVYAYISGLPMLAYNGRVYFVRKPTGTPYLASVLFDGSDLRDEDTSDGTKIRLEFFV